MIATAASEINLFPTYTSRWVLKFLASRIFSTIVITMLLTVGVFTVLQLSAPVSVAMGVTITTIRISTKIRELRQNEAWDKVMFGGTLFIFVPKQRHNVRTQMMLDTMAPRIEDVQSMISFTFPGGYGWKKREPTMAVQKSRTPDIKHTRPAMILMAGLVITA